MLAEGADLLDVGGEWTQLGAVPVSLEEELRRVVPVVERLVAELGVPVSVDTTKAEVARQALLAGAGMINDVSTLRADPEMATVVTETQVPVVLMHLGARQAGARLSDSKSMQGDTVPADIIAVRSHCRDPAVPARAY